MSGSFHPITGELVILSNGNRTAQRNQPSQEFNNGLVMSLEPLRDNQLFEVRIDKKVNSWTGSIEIGVTTWNPCSLEFPSSAADLREHSWVMSGSSVLKDGHPVTEEYGQNLDSLEEGDRVGVMRTSQGDLHFFVNGVSQGTAARAIPSKVYAVVDMYGKCAQITLVENTTEARLLANEINNESTLANGYNNSGESNSNNNNNNNNHVCNNIAGGSSSGLSSTIGTISSISSDRLHFHEHTGTLVKLSNNNRTAERRRPFDEFNNGVVMTHRALRENELFEIRIDSLVNKWSGSIEVGITTHNPSTLQFPATMTNMRSGTTMMSGCGILTNGKGTRREYGEYNLDELKVGDRIGLMRKCNGNLHYYINGVDQGVAATKVPATVFGVVDLYGMTVKVTIVDRDDRIEQGLANHRNNTIIREFQLLNGTLEDSSQDGSEKLYFHSRCGKHAAVINNGKSAHRPVAVDDFDHAVVLTNRPLRPYERFEVHLDMMVVKWAGSLEIGVTTHSPFDLEFPSTMTNIRSGTWMMTGNGIMHNGTTIIDDYGQNLDRLRVGDLVGVMRKDNGTLHFFVNGMDQGVAATNVPERVYGVIDLYGQAAQCTIIDHLEVDDEPQMTCANTNTSDLLFHYLHGQNARISNGGLTSSRMNAHSEFNDAIVISNRTLRDGEMFEVILDKMVDRWSGSIEAGVTAIKPEDLEFPNTMTDIDHDTWMLSGSAIMQDGCTVTNYYKCDLDSLSAGTRIGMMRCVDATLHYYINGEDMGVACTNIPSNVYAVIDLYGQCAQVTIIPPSSCLSDSATSPPTHTETLRPSLVEGSDVTHNFSSCCGKNITLSSNSTVACRVRGFNHGLVFSGSPLQPNEIFEIMIAQFAYQWSGSLQIGLTGVEFTEAYPVAALPPHAGLLVEGVTWLVTGACVRKNGKLLRDNYGPSLDRLDVGDRVGVRHCSDGTMHVYLNGDDMGVAAANLPKRVFAVIDLYGSVEKVNVVSKMMAGTTPVEASRERRSSLQSSQSRDSLEHDIEAVNKEHGHQEFHENHGRNIILSSNNTQARRTSSYNQGVVLSQKPLSRGQLFQVRIEQLNTKWNSSLLVGLTVQPPEKNPLPVTALGLKKPSWVICGDSVFQNGTKVKGRYGPNLDSLQVRHLVGVVVDTSSNLHLYINGVDQGVAAKDIPNQCFAVVDLYGQCEEVTIVGNDETEERILNCSHREKADLEHGKKEKILRPPLVDQLLVNNCEYQNTCTRFKSSLGLPEGYFMPEYCICYCETCYKIRGDEAYYRKGDPPKDYAVPFGWCQYSLRIPVKAENSGVVDKWHVAFHGTQPSVIRKMLDCGELLLPGDTGLCISSKHISQKNKSKDIDSEASQICFSPTIRYAASSTFTPKFEFVDSKMKKRLFARVAVQVLVQPGAYNSGPQRIGAREPVDGHFNNGEIEWFTKEKGATILHSLLIKIDGL